MKRLQWIYIAESRVGDTVRSGRLAGKLHQGPGQQLADLPQQ